MTTRQASAPKVITQLNLIPKTFECNRLRLSIQRVPRQLAIAPDRYFLAVDFEGDRWNYPVQLTRDEAYALVEQAQSLRLPGGEG